MFGCGSGERPPGMDDKLIERIRDLVVEVEPPPGWEERLMARWLADAIYHCANAQPRRSLLIVRSGAKLLWKIAKPPGRTPE